MSHHMGLVPRHIRYMPIVCKGVLVSRMVRIVSSDETVEEVVVLFGFISKRLDLPVLAGLLDLLSFRLPFFLDLRWLDALSSKIENN